VPVVQIIVVAYAIPTTECVSALGRAAMIFVKRMWTAALEIAIRITFVSHSIVPLIAETGGIKPMIVDATALPEIPVASENYDGAVRQQRSFSDTLCAELPTRDCRIPI
jgi:hypothetical protein